MKFQPWVNLVGRMSAVLAKRISREADNTYRNFHQMLGATNSYRDHEQFRRIRRRLRNGQVRQWKAPDPEVPGLQTPVIRN